MVSYVDPAMRDLDRKRMDELFRKIIPHDKLREAIQYKQLEGNYCNTIESPLGLFRIKSCDFQSKAKK